MRAPRVCEKGTLQWHIAESTEPRRAIAETGCGKFIAVIFFTSLDPVRYFRHPNLCPICFPKEKS